MNRRLAALLVLVLALSACGRQGIGPAPTHALGPLSLAIDLQSTRLADRYEVVITVLDQNGTPVNDAAVAIRTHYDYFGLNPSSVRATPKGGGRYSAIIALPAGSGWLITADASENASRGHLEAQEDLN